MFRSEAVAPHLPFLRRYARALTGSQASGDAYVRACLEGLIADPDRMSDDATPRVALYRLFHVIWGTTVLPDPPDDEAQRDADRGAQARLRQLVPERRQALLLTALEGFSVDEVAVILDRTPADVQQLIAQVMEDIEREIATNVLIIEDEPIIALDLSRIVRDLGHTVMHVAVTRTDAVAAARRHRPGLILADIQLADRSSGIEAVRDILLDEGRIPVIFITAYPERLLTGKRQEPTFLITKPFLPDSVKAAISQALFFYPPVEVAGRASG
jgi:CheY-like chemotaxis protein